MKLTQSSPVDYSPDQACILSLKSGNNQALNEFYLLHRREFIRWAHRVYGLEPDEAMDIYQDTTLILFENISRQKLRELNSSLKTYFFAIGKNLIQKGIAYKKNALRRLQAIYPPMDSTQEENHPAFEHQPDTMEALLSGLEVLTERNQSIVKLFYYQRLSYKDIAEQLGYQSGDVVKNQKVRCVKYLRKLLEEKLNSDQ